MDGKEYIIESSGVEVTQDGKRRLVFVLDKVSANMMVDEVSATIHGIYDGKDYECQTKEYGVVTYVASKINASTGTFRTLLVDLLNYGTLAQLYTDRKTDNLANSILTEEHQQSGTQGDRATESILTTKYEVVDSSIAKWNAATIQLESAITIRYKVTIDDITGTKALITCGNSTYTVDSSEFELIKDTTNQYYIYFAKLDASQLSAPVYIKLVKDGVAVSNTLRYSVESYINNNYTSDKYGPHFVPLIKSIIKYGDSAKAYRP